VKRVVVLAVVSVSLALTACTPSVAPTVPPTAMATTSPVQQYGADGAPGSAQRLAAYDEVAADFPLQLPDGYVFPADGEALSENGYSVVLEHWIAATADAALRAETAGGTATADHYTAALAAAWPDTIRPTFGPSVEYIGQAIEERNFALLTLAFPVPDGITTN
jgi:hypothetical protein